VFLNIFSYCIVDTFGRQESTAKKRKIGRKIPIPAFLETGGSQRSRSSSRASRDEGGTASGERPSKAAERMLLTGTCLLHHRVSKLIIADDALSLSLPQTRKCAVAQEFPRRKRNLMAEQPI
jgi:hypothetical protein